MYTLENMAQQPDAKTQVFRRQGTAYRMQRQQSDLPAARLIKQCMPPSSKAESKKEMQAQMQGPHLLP